jgi:hypothetical protein
MFIFSYIYLKMGCCKSSPDVGASYLHPNSVHASSPLTQVELMQLGKILAETPEHCGEAILNVPSRQLLNLFQCHMMAIYHGSGREWQLALLCETQVTVGLKVLLPNGKNDHIFFNIYNTLSACYFALSELQAAIGGTKIAFAILLKHTPMDYTKLTDMYWHLGEVYKIEQKWKATAYYLTKAIETA